ncbi:hypothetical protein TWF481_001593 [Arthrobotrys musiformis]|uniref:Uncharacterized protein n=1 Tax=Arthrobotrys musiformis TaxID=47236 RepID=A0AAV9VWJ7_9PEZI
MQSLNCLLGVSKGVPSLTVFFQSLQDYTQKLHIAVQKKPFNAKQNKKDKKQTIANTPTEKERMSRASKVTLGLVSAVTGLIVVAVHNTQVTEREAMHQGVVRDEERQRIKRERALDFEMSAKLREEYEKMQPVSNSEDKPKR